MACSIAQVCASAVLLIPRRAAKAAVPAGVTRAAVARDLSAMYSQLLKPFLQLLIGPAVLLNPCTTCRHLLQDNDLLPSSSVWDTVQF